MTDDTTINHWLAGRGPINLCRTERKPTTRRDLRAAEGIIVSVLLGGNVILWGYVLVRAFT